MAYSGTHSLFRMPLPDIKQDESTSGTSNRNRIFVSYSHNDYGQFAKHFFEHLQLLIRNRSWLGYSVSDIFFDESRLKAGDIWDATIENAVKECEVMVFLVSRHSLMSKHCLNDEVRIAAKRDILLIPVILSDCEYQNITIGEPGKQRRLGSLQSLPQKEDAGRLTLVPVGRGEGGWGDSEYAWDQVVKQIAAALEKRKGGNRTTGLSPMVRRAVLPPLLPFRCNQNATVEDFENGLKEWNSSPLLAILKGTRDDRLEGFWERLRTWKENKSLKTRFHGYQDIQTRPLRLLPSSLERDRDDNDEQLKAKIWEYLSASVHQHQEGKSISSLIELAQALAGNTNLLVLRARLSIKENGEDIPAKAKVLRTLVNLLNSDSIPEDLEKNLENLIIVVLVERPTWNDDLGSGWKWRLETTTESDGFLASLFRRWRGKPRITPTVASRIQLVEPRPLTTFGREEVEHWIDDCEDQESISLDRYQLLPALFPDPKNEQPIRFTQFEKTLKEMNLID